MKKPLVTVHYPYGDDWAQVRLTLGNQQFNVGEVMVSHSAKWYARQMRVAIRREFGTTKRK